MKSYLAKLADRATLGNVSPSIPMRAKQHDLGSEILTVASPDDFTNPIRHRTDFLSSKSESISQPTPTPAGALPTETSKAEPSTLAKSHPQNISPSIIDLSVPRVIAEPRVNQEMEPSSSTSPDPTEQSLDHIESASLNLDLERLASVQQDQIGLLRRADEFMADLLTASPLRNHPSEIDDHSPKQQSSAERLQPQTQMPAPKASPSTRVAEPEPPSLVIGKITVEVNSPTLPHTQSSPITVVQVRDQRRGGVPSCRRFGLGQS